MAKAPKPFARGGKASDKTFKKGARPPHKPGEKPGMHNKSKAKTPFGKK